MSTAQPSYHPDLTSRLVHHLVRERARSLIHTPEFRRADLDDMAGYLWTALVQRARRYDDAKASFATFAEVVLQRVATSMVRSRRRLKRRGEIDEASIDDLHDGSGRVVGADALSERDGLRHRGCDIVCPIERLILHNTVNAVVSTLDDDEQALCRLWIEGCSRAEISESLGRSRDWVWRKLTGLQDRFRDAGLDPRT